MSHTFQLKLNISIVCTGSFIMNVLGPPIAEMIPYVCSVTVSDMIS